MISRRQFLKGAGAVSLAGILGLGCDSIFPTGEEPAPKDSLPVSIYFDDAVDLSEQGLSSVEKTVHIWTPVEDSFELDNGRIKTNEIWAAVVNSNERELFYRDPKQGSSIVYFGDSLDNTSIVYKGSRHNLRADYTMNAQGSAIEVGIEGLDEELTVNFKVVDGEIHSLGELVSQEEADEIIWRDLTAPTALHIGANYEDFTMKCGIKVKKPKIYGSVGRAELEVPAPE